MKIMYFADREHLVEYGEPITGDTYLKQEFGPVPSFSNYVANDKQDDYKGIFSRNGKSLTANVTADMDDLSESELECIDNAINTYCKHSFSDLTEASHEYAWESSDWHISYEKIAVEGGASEDMMSYIKEQMVNSNLSIPSY